MRYILPQGVGVNLIKAMTQKAQATTADHMSINLPQQYRWQSLVKSFIVHLIEKNTRLCRKTVNTFGNTIVHFIVGLDKLCLVSDAFGDLYVIGAANLKT